MAEWQKTVPCRYFKFGSCTRGEACPYLHVPEYTENTEYNQEEGYIEYTDENQYGTEDVQYGTEDVQYGSEDVQYGTDDVQYSRENVQFSPREDYTTSLTIGVGALGLDPCQDPNCPEEENSFSSPQEVGGAGALYPVSPTYILYSPVFHSPGHPVISPGISVLSPRPVVLSPGPGVLTPGHSALPPSHTCIADDIQCSQIYPPTPDSSFNSALSSSYPSTSSYLHPSCSSHPSSHPSYTLLSPATPISSTSTVLSLTPPKSDTPLAVETATTPVINRADPKAPSPICIKPLNPDPKEFIPRGSEVFQTTPVSTKLDPNPPEFTPLTTKLNPDPPVFVPLKRRSDSWKVPDNWAEAAEFVPKVETKSRSWAQVVNPNPQAENLTLSQSESELCPYFKSGECRYDSMCAYIHGDRCEYCGINCLHPHQPEQRRLHMLDCLGEHERDMELSFAVARSLEKTCGICMETVLDKEKGEARFGILPSCTHCFCLPCIRKWRQAKQFEHKIIRACPECRQTSDFICPSRFWVETVEEKDKLLTDYKKNLGLKECKYFNKGVGECPFGNKCFYKHEDKDGRVIDVGPPKKPARRTNAEGNLSLVQRLLLYDFLEERDGQLVFPVDFVELFDLYSDSDDWSDGDDV